MNIIMKLAITILCLALAALGAGFGIKLIREFDCRKSMVRKVLKMKRYAGWPLLAVMVLEKKGPGR